MAKIDKFVIPKEACIGGVKYSIKYPYEFDKNNPENPDGLHCWVDTSIKILGNAHKQRTTEVLIHELLHAIDHIYSDGWLSQDEGLHSRFASCLYYVFSNNKILSVDRLPKSVNICGYKYKVYYNYSFDDTVDHYLASSSVNEQTIYIPKHLDGIVVSDQIKKIGLLSMILHTIGCILYITDEEQDELNVRRPQYSHGIYQTFMDADIEQLAWLSKKG